jgi:hypothetical protein
MPSRFYRILCRITAVWRKPTPVGNVLYDAAGVQIGNIDVIRWTATHLRVAGWVADDRGADGSRTRVALCTGLGQVSATPGLPRPDVVATRGGGMARSDVGFDLTIPRDAGQARLVLSLGAARQIIQPLPLHPVP